jgi:RNA polymerase sigma-70 factor (ECF subfamily)
MTDDRMDMSEDIQAILEGNQEAFARLMKAHLPLVAHITARMVTDQEDRRDICQDVFLKVYSHLDRFRGESKLSTWIARIAYNTCLNHAQKKRPEISDDTRPGNRIDDRADDGAAPPEAETESFDVNERLHREIGLLPVRYRAVLTLFHLEGMRIGEIASVMGMPEGTVKNDLFRARRILKEKLLARYAPEELCGQGI